jgi:hypothetical protein
MNRRLAGLFWGIVLIAAGVYALALTLGYGIRQDPALWALIFGGISVLALVFYFVDGVRSWGWLFPAGVFGGLAIMMGLAAANIDNPVVAAPLFIGIGLPFVAAFVIDRARNWWALIPAGVMALLTLLILAADSVPGEWIATGLFLFLALGFLLAYLGRRALWAALVAYVMAALAAVTWLGTTSQGELVGSLVFLAIGIPFLFVYLRYPDRWWAIIPAGIMVTMGIALAALLVPGLDLSIYKLNVSNAIVLAGIAATFSVVWLRERRRWAMIVSLVFGIGTIGALSFAGLRTVWPLLLIAAGLLLLYRAFRPRPV